MPPIADIHKHNHQSKSLRNYKTKKSLVVVMSSVDSWKSSRRALRPAFFAASVECISVGGRGKLSDFSSGPCFEHIGQQFIRKFLTGCTHLPHTFSSVTIAANWPSNECVQVGFPHG
jgi:hypothetical protein